MKVKEGNYYDSIKRLLLNQKIDLVFYEEKSRVPEKECWQYTKNIHSVESGVLLKLSNEELIKIKCCPMFYEYGVGIQMLNSFDFPAENKLVNLSKDENWQEVLDSKITGVEIHWDFADCLDIDNMEDCAKQIQVPHSWQITFENQLSVWISAMHYNDIAHRYWADHLTVAFQDAVARRLKMPSDEKHMISSSLLF